MSIPTKEVSDFLEVHRQMPNQTEFWAEEFRNSVIAHLESWYKPEIIKQWSISDIIINADKVLIKWHKRIIPG